MTTHLKTFDIVGKKESVADYISMLDPTDVPFTSSIKSEKITNTLHQWQEDQLRAVTKNTALEGADATDTNRDQPSMRQNGTQILTETFRVSGSADAAKMYGRASIVARETMKTGKLLKMDLEHSNVGTGQTYVVAAGATEGEFAGVQAQIAAGVTTDLAGAALTEASVVDTHEKLYNEGADAGTLMIKPSDSKIVASWLGAGDRTIQAKNGDTKITNVVNVYQSPFGVVRVKMNRRIRATDALLYDPKNWKQLTYRNWNRTKLAKNGDSDRWQVVGEFSLKHTNQLATGLITGLT
jgi:hypothetical protein